MDGAGPVVGAKGGESLFGGIDVTGHATSRLWQAVRQAAPSLGGLRDLR